MGYEARVSASPRGFYYDPVIVPGETDPRGGLNDAQTALMNAAIQVLRMQGAEIVDPADIPSVVSPESRVELPCLGRVCGTARSDGV